MKSISTMTYIELLRAERENDKRPTNPHRQNMLAAIRPEINRRESCKITSEYDPRLRRYVFIP